MTPASVKTISWRWLLALHLIIPVLLLVWFIDKTFFEYSLLPHMGMGALLLPLYLLVFELPHIIGSLLTFADAEYVRFYRGHLILGIPVLLGLVGGLLYFVPTLAFLFYILATMYHVLRQQTGIASILAKQKGFVFTVWTASMIVATSIMLALASVPATFSFLEVRLYSLVALLAVGVSTVAGVLFALKSKTLLGRYYILATTLLVGTSYFFALVSYFFFAVFVIRFVHDVTAFTFYVVHDQNRNASTVHNYFYALLAKIKIPLLIGVPLASIIIALVLRLGISGTTVATAITVLFGFAHYYVEAVMWKRDSLHRQQISFSG
jgi:hypothetical protein